MKETRMNETRTPRERITATDRRDPGAAFLEQETEDDRRSERRLFLYAGIALAVVAVLVVVRLVFFV